MPLHTPVKNTNSRKEMQLYRVSDFAPVLSHSFISLIYRLTSRSIILTLWYKQCFDNTAMLLSVVPKILTVNKPTTFVEDFCLYPGENYTSYLEKANQFDSPCDMWNCKIKTQNQIYYR
jgi:hypothetical protein